MQTFSSKGISLIEVIISISILAICLAGFITTYGNLSHQTNTLKRKQTALRLLQKELEECTANIEECLADPNRQDKIIIDGSIIGDLKFYSDGISLRGELVWGEGNISLSTIW